MKYARFQGSGFQARTTHSAIILQAETDKNALVIAEGYPGGLRQVVNFGDYAQRRFTQYSCNCYRLKGDGYTYSQRAALVAQRWISARFNDPDKLQVTDKDQEHGGEDLRIIISFDDSYSMNKSLKCAITSSGFGSAVANRAAMYREHSHSAPPLSISDPKRFSRMFCSEFVVAAWQTALTESQTQQYMAKDALHTSPRALEDYLESNPHWFKYHTF